MGEAADAIMPPRFEPPDRTVVVAIRDGELVLRPEVKVSVTFDRNWGGGDVLGVVVSVKVRVQVPSIPPRGASVTPRDNDCRAPTGPWSGNGHCRAQRV